MNRGLLSSNMRAWQTETLDPRTPTTQNWRRTAPTGLRWQEEADLLEDRPRNRNDLPWTKCLPCPKCGDWVLHLQTLRCQCSEGNAKHKGWDASVEDVAMHRNHDMVFTWMCVNLKIRVTIRIGHRGSGRGPRTDLCHHPLGLQCHPRGIPELVD